MDLPTHLIVNVTKVEEQLCSRVSNLDLNVVFVVLPHRQRKFELRFVGVETEASICHTGEKAVRFRGQDCIGRTPKVRRAILAAEVLGRIACRGSCTACRCA